MFASPPLILRNVDLEDSSSFIWKTLNRSLLNLTTRRPVKHETGSSQNYIHYTLQPSYMCCMIISAFEFHKWHFIGQLVCSFLARSVYSETSLVQNLFNTQPAAFFTVRLLTVSNCVTRCSTAPSLVTAIKKEVIKVTWQQRQRQILCLSHTPINTHNYTQKGMLHWKTQNNNKHFHQSLS